MSNSPPSTGPNLFFAGGECLTRFGVWVRRTDVDLEEATREAFTRNSDAEAIGRDGILRTWQADNPRAEYLNEADIEATRNLMETTDLTAAAWGKLAGLDPVVAAGNGFAVTDPTATNTSFVQLVSIQVPASSNSITISLILRKLKGAPTVHLLIDHTGQHGIVVDPETGLFNSTGSPDAVRVTDLGTEWLLEVVRSGIATSLFYTFYPAWAPAGDISGGQFNSPIGTARIRGVQAEVGTVATDPQEMPRDTDRKFPSLLIEAAATNEFTFSEELDNAAWTKTDASISANETTAPDGATTADRLVENAAAATQHFLRRTLGGVLTDNTDQAISLFAKAAERDEFRIRILGKDGTFRSAFYNVGTGFLGTISNASARMEALPDGWFRCEIVATVGAGGTTPRVEVQISEGGEVISYTGDGVSGVFLWGLQFEDDDPAVTSYIPTGGATAARAADDFRGPYPHPPQEMTVYSKFVELGTFRTNNAGVFHIGAGGAGVDPRLHVRSDKDLNGEYEALYDDGVTGSRQSILVGSPAIGDLVELRTVLYSDGSVQIFQTLNGLAPENAADRSTASTIPPAWAGRIFFVGSRGETDVGEAQILAAKAHRGVRSLDFMRAL